MEVDGMISIGSVATAAAKKIIIKLGFSESGRKFLLIILLIPIVFVMLLVFIVFSLVTTLIPTFGDDLLSSLVSHNQVFPLPEGYFKSYTSPYGMRIHPVYGTKKMHKGLDISSYKESSTPLIAIEDGIVELHPDSGSAGNYLVLKTKKGYSWIYMHLSRYQIGINNESKVKCGQVIGYMGSTGIGTGVHLHIQKNMDDGTTKDPFPLLEELRRKKVMVKVKNNGNGFYTTIPESIPIGKRVTTIMSHEKFIKTVAQGCSNLKKQHGRFPSVTIAQAALENNWGTGELSLRGQALFGIKADDSWNGKKGLYLTREYNNFTGKFEPVNDWFREYNNWNESLLDHTLFLRQNPTYSRNGVFVAKTYEDQCYALQKARYATDPSYAKKLIGMIEENGLDKYDKDGFIPNFTEKIFDR
jgi:flagellum-specific peptidoglycan hydrolase FlgJ